jgi:GMP synthase-like glutamine amidotransferase
LKSTKGTYSPIGGASTPPSRWAVLLATSPAYPNQAFRWKKKAYGVQFHVEIAADLAKQWSLVPAYSAALERLLGPDAATKVVDDVSREEKALHSHARSMFENWLEACGLL